MTPEQFKTMKALFQKAAEALVYPEKILIRWRAPASVTSAGVLSKSLEGKFIIDISPLQTVQEIYLCFLHEIAHVLTEGETLKRSGYSRLQSESYSLAPEDYRKRKASAKVLRREYKATIAAKWLESYAEASAYKHWHYGEPEVNARLRSLYRGTRTLFWDWWKKKIVHNNLEKIQ